MSVACGNEMPGQDETETTWSGEILDPNESDPDDGVSAVVLWPVN